MSNPANYSPYNKTYKFILFQNQAYHQRNKRNISPCVRTNMRHSLSRHSPNRNPEGFAIPSLLSVSQLSHISPSSSPRASEAVSQNSRRSKLFVPNKQIERAIISEPKRVIHKNLSYQKFRKQRISQQNFEMVNRILELDCQVIKNAQTDKAFKNHQRYENIRRKYNESGRKDVLPLGQSQLLCPTLQQFHASGLGEKFIAMDMSMSIKPATTQSPRKINQNNSAV